MGGKGKRSKMVWKLKMERAAKLSVVQVYFSGMENLPCLVMYDLSRQGRFLPPILDNVGHYLFTLSTGTGGMQLMLNVQIKGRRRNYHLLWNAVWHADSCAWVCTHMHTLTLIYVHTKRPRRRWGEKVFSLTLSLTKGVSEFCERAVKIWRRIQLQLVFHICVGCSGFQIKSAS